MIRPARFATASWRKRRADQTPRPAGDPGKAAGWIGVHIHPPGLTSDPANPKGKPIPNPDAELIRICEAHSAIIVAVNDYGSGEDHCPLWLTYERSRNAINAAVPVTLAGMVAKARAAKAEARNLDGSESPNGCRAETWAWAWAWDLVNDLLRLEGMA